MYEIDENDILIKSGTNTWNGTSREEKLLQVHNVESLYSVGNFGYISLFKVRQPFSRPRVNKIRLAGKQYNYTPGKSCRLFGHGASFQKHENVQLQFFPATIIDSALCNYELRNYTLCLSSVKGGRWTRDTCYGDKGGPIIQGGKSSVLIGIINTEKCGSNKGVISHIKVGSLEEELRAFSKNVNRITGLEFVSRSRR
ncbi:hypothetical protein ILUMI_13811 [Ignelater luminosus]|uniref:Peptidase S1 domain-containing protein n=1 Tax=Ignelater luminosus TaxID=2038154 RepID=A0A8K0G8B5_IGNLU|nr:hypothetical protein ILUMI_13811 [Ignelater luminosus]